jgi:tetratricopeptide (TPR) repeat protein
MYIMQGNYKEAGETLEQFLVQDKSDDYMYFLYGFSNRMMWKNAGEIDYCHKVIKAMNSSVRLNPRNGKAYLYMAESYLALDDKDNARAYIHKAIGSGNKWVKEEDEVLSELKKQLGDK